MSIVLGKYELLSYSPGELRLKFLETGLHFSVSFSQNGGVGSGWWCPQDDAFIWSGGSFQRSHLCGAQLSDRDIEVLRDLLRHGKTTQFVVNAYGGSTITQRELAARQEVIAFEVLFGNAGHEEDKDSEVNPIFGPNYKKDYKSLDPNLENRLRKLLS